jgi:chemotaxis protein MotB
MKLIVSFITLVYVLSACVPAKKYNDLLAAEKQCQEDLERYKTSSLNYEGQARDYQTRYEVASEQLVQLKQDTTKMGQEIRLLRVLNTKSKEQMESLTKRLESVKKTGEQTTASLQAELEAKNLELQRKEAELAVLENDLKIKEKLLAEREARVFELEEAIRRKDEAQNLLKQKVAEALIGFKNQGLTVVQKNGKIYVSLEAKLLFGSGSTNVEAEGKRALIELAKVLEAEEGLEFVVEGHTDSDKLASANHPKNNWELSVLRATSVVEIMLANSKMNPTQVMAAGRSEFLPVDIKDKAKNRRIEIIISPNLNELFDIISK